MDYPQLLIVCAFICAALVSHTASAADYPAKPVRIIVAQPAGGNADLVARSFAQRLTERFGVQFVVDNRGGGAGVIGTELTDDPRGTRFVILGFAVDELREIEVVCRFLPSGLLRIITVYELRV